MLINLPLSVHYHVHRLASNAVQIAMLKMSPTHHFQFIFILVLSLETAFTCFATTSIPQELLIGFSASPHPTTASFEPLLSDPTGNFSLGFLRQNGNQLALAVIHVASSEPFWLANTAHLASWSDTTRLSFNGSLVLWDPQTGASWSTATIGDRVVLLNTSNLQVRNNKGNPVWESFQFPTNTLVQGQNFTVNMTLTSVNGFYSLRLGEDFMGLYENNGKERLLYWKRTPLEAKAEIQEGEGPIYARVNEDGYLGMYQTSSKPVDVEKFNSFQQVFTTSSFLFLRLEPDGNLKGYYWNSTNWLLNYQAISELCDLPSPCGSYGLCTPGGSGCSCLDNRIRFEPGGCLSRGEDDDGDFCSGVIGGTGNGYSVLRRIGVEPPHKELLEHETTSSLAECEALCEKNCSCWGALYNNVTEFCFLLDYPIQTMLGTGDESKVGYFKIRKDSEQRNRVRVRVGIVVAVLIGIIIVGVVFCVMRWKRRKGMNGLLKEENGASPGPYKNLGSASFRSIEMSNNAK